MIIMPIASWAQFKAETIGSKGLLYQYQEHADRYELFAAEAGIFVWTMSMPKIAGDDLTDWEDNYKSNGNRPLTDNVTTQLEKNDKTLRTFWAHGETDAAGLVKIYVQIPGAGRFIAYGDAEFEDREFLDHISKIEVSDLDRGIAWQMALAMNPAATEPLSDADVITYGGPRLAHYPVLDHYDERAFPETPSDSSEGTIIPGMAMTFKYGITEAQPVAGYAWIPGGLYLMLECQKETAAAGKRCKISIDWAEPQI